MLQEIYNSYVHCAAGLGDYQKLSKTELANGYCDAKTQEVKDQYFSALMLRYWYKIYEWSKNSISTKLEPEDYSSWLVEAISLALKICDFNVLPIREDNRIPEWRDPKSKMFNDPNGPDKVINRCIFSIRNYYYQNFNKDKRKINYICSSIEAQEEAFGDAAEAIQYASIYDEDSSCGDLIQLLIDKNRLLEAIVVEGIAYEDVFKEDKDSSYCFNKRKLVKYLKNLNKDYIIYFHSRFGIDAGKVEESVSFLKSLPNNKLYEYIDKTLDKFKTDKTIKEALC